MTNQYTFPIGNLILTSEPAMKWQVPTLRDQFAMAAMQGLLASDSSTGKPERFAAWCYEMADAMMKEREKQP